MATVISVPARSEGPAEQRRRRWRVVVGVGVLVVILAAIGAGLGFWRYAATYAPLGPGSGFGPYGPDRGNVVIRSTDLGDELYLHGPAGTEGEVITQLGNNGSHGVTIQRFVRGGLVADFRWSPYVTRPGGSVDGEPLPLRQLPANIPAQGQIRVVLTLRKPMCVPGGVVNTNYVILYWDALGAHHEYHMPLSPDGSVTFVGCPRYILRRPH